MMFRLERHSSTGSCFVFVGRSLLGCQEHLLWEPPRFVPTDGRRWEMGDRCSYLNTTRYPVRGID